MIDMTICEVPAGAYPIGNNKIRLSRPEHTVLLSAFAIGQTTVTNAQYRLFVEDDGYRNRVFWTEMGWHWLEGQGDTTPGLWLDERYNAPDQPVVGVSWYEAVAFSRWLARHTGLAWRLPSEAEWEAAARGPEGEAPRPRNYNTVERELGHAWPVTEQGNVSWCGAYDMCGNVWEWCSTRWGRNFQTWSYAYPYRADDERENVEDSYARIMRGGSWFDPLPEADPANRARYLPGSRGSNIGFRLARSL